MASYQLIKNEKVEFEKTNRVYDKAILTFRGIDGYDVYNCSVPFTYKDKRHIFGRVEKRA